MTDDQTANGERTLPPEPWDESRVVVALIGVCLLIESGLVYYQAGMDQAIVASVTGIAGLVLFLVGWLVPLDDETLLQDIHAEKPQTIEVPPAPPPDTGRVQEPGLVAPPPVTVDQKPESPVPVAAEQPSLEPAPMAPAHAIAPVAEVPIPQVVPELGPETEEEEAPVSWLQRLRTGLAKTRDNFVGKLKRLIVGKTTIDGDLLEELEGTLFEADMGVDITTAMLEFLHKKVDEQNVKDPQQIYALLRDQLRQRLLRFPPALNLAGEGLSVLLIVGVNGVGKTTTIAKLARRFKKEGRNVVLAAGDTFRAAAIDQLCIWGERAGVEVIRGQEGGDPGALVFDAIHAARKRNADLLIVDTAGRMHVKTNLMAELKKVRKIIEKESGGPHETLLVLDATTGQNAVQQAKLFHEALPISGLVITKLDGTAKGGVLLAVEEQIAAPVKFIGLGEKMDDLMPFDPEEFLNALFQEEQVKTKDSDYKVL